MKLVIHLLLIVCVTSVTPHSSNAQDWQAINVDADLLCGQILYDHNVELKPDLNAGDQLLDFVKHAYPSFLKELLKRMNDHPEEKHRAYSWFLSRIRGETLPDAMLTLSRSQFARDKKAAGGDSGKLAEAEDRYLANLKAIARHFDRKFAKRRTDGGESTDSLELSDVVYLDMQLEWLVLFGEVRDDTNRMSEFLDLFRESPVRTTVINWYAAAKRCQAIAFFNQGHYSKAQDCYLNVLSRFPNSSFEKILTDELCVVMQQHELSKLAKTVPQLVNQVSDGKNPESLKLTYSPVKAGYDALTPEQQKAVNSQRDHLAKRIRGLRRNAETALKEIKDLREKPTVQLDQVDTQERICLGSIAALDCLINITIESPDQNKGMGIHLPDDLPQRDLLDSEIADYINNLVLRNALDDLKKAVVNAINNSADRISESIMQQTGELQASLKNIEHQIENLSDTIKTELKKVTKAVTKVNNSLDELNKKAADIEAGINRVNQTSLLIYNEAKETNKQLNNLNKKADKIIEVSEEIRDTTKQVVTEIQGLRSEMRKSRRKRGRFGIGSVRGINSVPGVGHVQDIAKNARDETSKRVDTLKDQVAAGNVRLQQEIQNAAAMIEEAPAVAGELLKDLLTKINPEITVFDFTIDIRGSGNLVGSSAFEFIGPGGIKLDSADLSKLEELNLKRFADAIGPAALSFFASLDVRDDYATVQQKQGDRTLKSGDFNGLR